MKKVLALALAAVMVMALVGTAFAAEHAISVSDTTTHTYEIYQIFKGNYDSTSGQLQDLVYGANAVGTENEAVSQAHMTAFAGFAEKETNGTYANDQEKIADLEAYVNFSSNPVATIGHETDPQVFTATLPEGYYVIKDKTGSVSEPNTYTLYIFTPLTADLAISAKDGTTTHDKLVQENSNSEWQHHADYNIGDDVPYTLEVTLPANYAMYKEYALKFIDDMSAGLTLNTGSVKIHYGATDTTGTAISLTEDTSASSAYTGGKVYTYTIDDLKLVNNEAAEALVGGDKVTITYTAKLNSSAVITEAGNPNAFKIEYSNNPNATGGGKNTTPPVITVVFTYKTIFDKIDQDSNALQGADFELYKKTGSGNTDADWTLVTELHTGEGAVNPSKTLNGSTYEDSDTFTFAGLDQGEYKLVETQTPAGYNPIQPIFFTITATFDESGEVVKLDALTGTDNADTIVLTPTVDSTHADLDADIMNKSGTVLPSTGGIGTTIFYVSGLIMVLGASIILISRRRADAE